MKPLKPYYRTNNKLFFRKGKKKMKIIRTGVGNYTFDGDVIEGNLEIKFPENNPLNIPVEIKVYK